MKTSFYFFLWIIIYPLLGLTRNQWIYQNSFIVALVIVWAVSWFLNRSIPDILRYERVSDAQNILEEIFEGNIKAFRKRLTQKVTIDFITAIYLGVAFVFILFTMVKGSADDWIALLIFGIFAFGTISRAFKLNQLNKIIQQNPTREQCISVIENFYHLDYNSYYSSRLQASMEEMLPPKPRYFKAFQIFSLLIAVACGCLGLYYLINSIILLTFNHNPDAISAGIMYFLYGSLATYFGFKDSFSSASFFKRKRNFQEES